MWKVSLRTKESARAAVIFANANAELEKPFEDARLRLESSGDPRPSQRDRAVELVAAYFKGSASREGGLDGSERLLRRRPEAHRGLRNAMPRGCSAVRSSGPEERWQQAANATLFRSRRGTLKHLTGLAPGEVWRYLTASMILFEAVVGSFSFDVTVLSDWSKTIHGAPAGERTEWKERIAAIVPSDPRDEDLARLLLEQARTFTRYYYVRDTNDASRSFETVDTAGSLDVLETLEAASSDLVSVHIGENSYEAGIAHPNSNAFLNIM